MDPAIDPEQDQQQQDQGFLPELDKSKWVYVPRLSFAPNARIAAVGGRGRHSTRTRAKDSGRALPAGKLRSLKAGTTRSRPAQCRTQNQTLAPSDAELSSNLNFETTTVPRDGSVTLDSNITEVLPDSQPRLDDPSASPLYQKLRNKLMRTRARIRAVHRLRERLVKEEETHANSSAGRTDPTEIQQQQENVVPQSLSRFVEYNKATKLCIARNRSRLEGRPPRSQSKVRIGEKLRW